MESTTHLVTTAHMHVCVSAFYFLRGQECLLPHAGFQMTADNYNQLAQALWDMNAAAAMIGRAPGSILPNYRAATIARPAYTGAPAGMFKALQYLARNCAAGRIPKDWALYTDLAETLCGMASHIVMQSPEYRAAPWHVERPALGVVR